MLCGCCGPPLEGLVGIAILYRGLQGGSNPDHANFPGGRWPLHSPLRSLQLPNSLCTWWAAGRGGSTEEIIVLVPQACIVEVGQKWLHLLTSTRTALTWILVHAAQVIELKIFRNRFRTLWGQAGCPRCPIGTPARCRRAEGFLYV